MALTGNDVTTLGLIILEIGDELEGLGTKFYYESESFDAFPRKLELLRSKHEFWQAEFEKFAKLLSYKALLEALHEAKSLLEAELARLEKRAGQKGHSCGFGCWRKPPNMRMLFPEKLGQSVEKVIDAFDAIPGFLRAEEEAASALERKLLPISKDHRYVPLKASESAICSALERRPGLSVILLHGGPGKGKSSLARAMAVRYKKSSNKAARFEHVVYLNCGARADAASKQFELFQLLSLDVDTFQDEALSGSELTGTVPTVPERLSTLLKAGRSLLVLDDVRNGEFLHSMVDICSGTSTQCLVTSQQRDLSRGVNASAVDLQVEVVKPADARRMVASHAGLRDLRIPLQLQGIANKLIRETQANPLALTIIAGDIAHKLSDENGEWNQQRSWEAASNRFFHLLQSEDTSGKKYPRGVWSAMRLSSETLSTEEKRVLILMSMCEGPCVPEEVIQCLHRSTQFRGNSTSSFEIVRKKLERRQLLNISPVSANPTEQRTWSIHSLYKQFIKEEMIDVRESAFTSLGGAWSTPPNNKPEQEIIIDISDVDVSVMTTIGALYFDDDLAKRVISKTDVASDRFNNRRRNAVEPITRLLGLPLSKQWSESLKDSASTIFMQYVRNNVLDSQGVVDLLSSPLSAPAVLTSIKDIAIIEKQPLLNAKDNSQRVVTVLAGLLVDTGRQLDGQAAAKALYFLCHEQSHRAFIVSQAPDVLDAIVRALSMDSTHPEVQVWSAWIMGNLSRANTAGASRTIVQRPGALFHILRALWRSDIPLLQLGAAWTLSNLASGDNETKQEIVDTHGALDGLGKLLSKDSYPKVRAQVAVALANLAGGGVEKKSKIVNYPGLLDKLVQSLSADDNPDLQRHAARALASVAAGDGEIKRNMLDAPQVLEKLVKSVSENNSHYLQKHAARGLANLAAGDAEKKSRISSCPGALEQLVKSLSKVNNPDLQEHGARALANLAAGDSEMKARVINFDGAVEELVKLLSSPKGELQDHAAAALAHLSGADNENKLKIASCPGAIEELSKCLSKDERTDLQRHAVRALVSLAAGSNETKLKITNSRTVVKEIEKCSSDRSNSYLQKHATKALANLAAKDGEFKRRPSSHRSRRSSRENSSRTSLDYHEHQ